MLTLSLKCHALVAWHPNELLALSNNRRIITFDPIATVKIAFRNSW